MVEIHRPISGWRPSTPEIVADDFALLSSSHPALAIHFWAAWNGYDPPLDKNIQAIASRLAGRVYFVSCDVDRLENRSLYDRCRIANVPTIAVFKGDELTGLIVGLRGPEQLIAEIEKLLTKGHRSRVRQFWRKLSPF
jgi:thioredoxin-like negative regulator of GroEL